MVGTMELGGCGNKIAERGTKSWRTHAHSRHYQWIKRLARPPGWIRFPRYVIQLSVHDWTLQPDPHGCRQYTPHCALHLVMVNSFAKVIWSQTRAYYPRIVLPSVVVLLVHDLIDVCPRNASNVHDALWLHFKGSDCFFWLVVAFQTFLVQESFCVYLKSESVLWPVISISCLHCGRRLDFFTVKNWWLRFLIYTEWTAMVQGKSHQPVCVTCKCMISH